MKKKLKDYVIDASSENGYRYVGVYFCSKLSGEQRKKYGLQQLIGSVGIGIMILAMTFIDSVGNRMPYVVFPLEFVLVCIGFYVSGSYALYKSEHRMERRTYEKAYVNTVSAVTIAMILTAISLIGEIVVIVNQFENLTGYADYVFLILLLALLVIEYAAWKWHRRLFTMAYEEPKS